MTTPAPKKNPIGRPPLYKDARQLKKAIGRYFKFAKKRGELFTIPGICHYLGFCDRNALSELARKKEFSSTVTRARLIIEHQRNQGLLTAKSSRGHEFDLKNNFGWIDRQEIEQTGDIVVNVVSYAQPAAIDVTPQPDQIEEETG